MYIEPLWGELPQLVLTNIYSYLSKQDRLQASSTCWNFRNALFQPKFFDKVTFHVSREKRAENAFYLETIAHFCHTIRICFNPLTLYGAQQTGEILLKIKSNNCAQRLILRPKYTPHPHPHYRRFLEQFLSKRNFMLRELDMGGMGCLTEHPADLLQMISCPQYVEGLALASVQCQPSTSQVLPIPTGILLRFENLQKLSIDYEHLSDECVEVLAELQSFRQLIVHVGCLEEGRPVSTETWLRLTKKNPLVRLQLILIYAFDAAYDLHHLLDAAMPLSHLTVLFCEYLHTLAIDFLSNYKATLESLIWIETGPTNVLMPFTDYQQDPLVMLAWRCKKLTTLVLNGIEIDAHNLIGIARLRGGDLQRLEVSHVEWTAELCDEVGKQLGRNWTPLPKTRLNSIFVHDGRFNLQLQNEYVMKCVQEAFEGA